MRLDPSLRLPHRLGARHLRAAQARAAAAREAQEEIEAQAAAQAAAAAVRPALLRAAAGHAGDLPDAARLPGPLRRRRLQPVPDGLLGRWLVWRQLDAVGCVRLRWAELDLRQRRLRGRRAGGVHVLTLPRRRAPPWL
eukprot:4727253-Prymnesium_polylepis.1